MFETSILEGLTMNMVCIQAMSASLIGRLGSSTFRLSRMVKKLKLQERRAVIPIPV
jgi:hypothetical protein